MSEVSPKSPEAFEIPCKDGLSIRGDIFPADAPIGSVIVCHGFKGFAHWAFFPYLGQKLAENGLTAITFDFSGSGIGPDRESFTLPEAFATNTFSREQDDLDILIDYLRRRKIIGRNFGLFGHSRGGATAIIFAAAVDSDVSALVTWASISYPNRWSPEDVKVWRQRGHADITNSRTGQIMKLRTDLLDDVELHGRNKLNIEAAAAKVRVPWLIIHGTSDETVPSTEAEKLHALSEKVSTLSLVPSANHAFDAKHPLTEIPPALNRVVRETVQFFVRNAATGV